MPANCCIKLPICSDDLLSFEVIIWKKSDSERSMAGGCRRAGLTTFILQFGVSTERTALNRPGGKGCTRCARRVDRRQSDCHCGAAQGQKPGPQREGTFEVMNWGCLAFSGKGAWRLTLPVALKKERMHSVTPAVVLISTTLLYDTYRERRAAGLPLHPLIFFLPLQQRGDLEEINCAPPVTIMRDVALQCVRVICLAVRTNAVRQALLRVAYAEMQDLLWSPTLCFSSEKSERASFIASAREAVRHKYMSCLAAIWEYLGQRTVTSLTCSICLHLKSRAPELKM